jgi:4-carboxymuconolactone decarboxylase
MPSPSAFLASSREPRIAPLDAPYPEEIERMLAKWMGPIRDRDPLRLFRTLSIHGELASRMGVLGAGLLGSPRVTPRECEIVIQRINTARGGAECEWGVHTKVFGENVELNEAQLAATAHGASDDLALSERDRLLIRLADEIHEAADLSDSLWSKADRALVERGADRAGRDGRLIPGDIPPGQHHPSRARAVGRSLPRPARVAE